MSGIFGSRSFSGGIFVLILLWNVIDFSRADSPSLKNMPDKPNIEPNTPDISSSAEMVFQNKCIEDLGCFYTGKPFYHSKHRPVSLPPTDNLMTRFLLYTRNNSKDEQLLDFAHKSIRNSYFNPKHHLKVLTHGFVDQLIPEHILFQIKDALLRRDHYNVIVLDWSKHNLPPYEQAVANTRVIGAQLAKMLKIIMETTGLPPKDIHLIGHSLGAHMIGYAGKRIPGLGRITGLDPAGPQYEHKNNAIRLDPADAEFVDVIHTNAGNDMSSGLGTLDALGHMDFYPNGGTSQPGCDPTSDSPFSTIFNERMDPCSHLRSAEYFKESIDSSDCHFLGVRCNSYDDFKKGNCTSLTSEMGYHAKKKSKLPVKSKFYLKTSDGAGKPFCIQRNTKSKHHNNK